MEISTVLRKNIFKEKLSLVNIPLYTVYALAFFVPLVIAKPQLLVGSIINFLIVISTLKYGLKKTIPVVVIPSLVATGTGLLFGGATIFLVYLMPFIMISNGIMSYLISKKNNIFFLILGIFLKVLFLFSITLILTKIIGLPSIFLSSMGYLQLYTGLIGGSIAYSLFLLSKQKLCT